jgi:hypothetical protein
LIVASTGWSARHAALVVSHLRTETRASSRVISRQAVGALRLEFDWTSAETPDLEPFVDRARAGWHLQVAARGIGVRHGAELGSRGLRRRSSIEVSGRNDRLEWNAELSSRDWPLPSGARVRLEPRSASSWHIVTELRADTEPGEPLGLLVSSQLRGRLGRAELSAGAKAALGRALTTAVALGSEVRLVRLQSDEELLFVRLRLGRWEGAILRQPSTSGIRLWGQLAVRLGGAESKRR